MDPREAAPSFRRLRAFDMVARTGSLSAAAQELRLSQPAVTQSLNLLEAQLGRRLFDRNQDGSFLNAAGRIFHRRVARFLDQVSAALAAVAPVEPSESLDGMVRKIGSSQTRAILAIWQTGSFRAAARALGVSEPSLQRPARELERLIGGVLYRRSAVGLGVNAQGADLARRLALAIGEIRSGAEEIWLIDGSSGQDNPAAGLDARANLRIGVLALSPRTLLADASAALLAAHPRQKIEVVEAPYQKLAVDLHEGAIDIMFGALRAPPPFPDLQEEELFEDPYSIVCRRDHPLTKMRRVTRERLSAYEWVFPTRGLPRRDVLDTLIASFGLTPHVQIETSCLSTINALLTTGDRLSLLSRWHIALDGHADLAQVESVRIPHARRCVGVTTRANWLPTPVQDAFLVNLRRAASPLRRSRRATATA